MPSMRLYNFLDPIPCGPPDVTCSDLNRGRTNSSQEKTDNQLKKHTTNNMPPTSFIRTKQVSPTSVASVMMDDSDKSQILQIYEDLNTSDASWGRRMDHKTSMTKPEKMKLNINVGRTSSSSKRNTRVTSTSEKGDFNESSLYDFSLVDFPADQGMEITDQQYYKSSAGKLKPPNTMNDKSKSQLSGTRNRRYTSTGSNSDIETVDHISLDSDILTFNESLQPNDYNDKHRVAKVKTRQDQLGPNDRNICTVMEESDKLVRQRHNPPVTQLQNLRTSNNKSLLETDDDIKAGAERDYRKDHSYRDLQNNFTKSKTNNPNGVSNRSDGFFSTKLLVPDADTKSIPSCLGYEGSLLKRDPAYRHAQQAGMMWQSIVGQHIRFPSRWWNGARAPPMGVDDADTTKWTYYERHSIRRHPVLNQLIRSRASAGRLLLHILVQDIISRQVILDIAIGCFHPNAKGVRRTERALRSEEESREIWLATRSRTRNTSCVSPIDQLISHHSNVGHAGCTKSPISTEVRVTNLNVRSVFGDTPPLETVYVVENEVQERLTRRGVSAATTGQTPLSMKLLQEFVFAE